MTSTGSDESIEFEGWLSHQLHLTLDSERGPRPRPEDARYSAASRSGGKTLIPIRSSILALGAKVAVGGTVAALAAGAATTGTVNPVNMSQRIADVVEQCKKDVRGDQPASAAEHHGIGECVSDIAQEHGQQVRAQHSEAAEKHAPGARPNRGKREGQESVDAASADHQGGDTSSSTSTVGDTDTGTGSRAHGKPSPIPSTH